MLIYKADEEGIIFHTGKMRELYSQISANHPTRKFLDPWRNSISVDEFHEQFVVYRLAHGTATLWTMAKNLEPKEVVQL